MSFKQNISELFDLILDTKIKKTMGVTCEIHLDKPEEGYFRPGSVLTGSIKYTLSKDTVFNSITVTIKGKAKCTFPNKDPINHNHPHHNHHQNPHYNPPRPQNFVGNEDILVLNSVIPTNETGVIEAGEHKASFNFTLPNNIPPSYAFQNFQYSANIKYYLRIKFSEPNLFKFAKRFRKEIVIAPTVLSNVSLEPITYALQKNLTSFFSSKKNCISLKATISKSLLLRNEEADLRYEVNNNSSANVPKIKTRVKSITTMRSDCGRSDVYDDTTDCHCETDEISSRTEKDFIIKLRIPMDAYTVQFSRIITREYKILVTVNVSGFHRDAHLEIPVQIGEPMMSNMVLVRDMSQVVENEPPPSYWEAMEEEKKEE